MSSKGAIKQLCEKLSLGILVDVCQGDADKSLNDLHQEYEDRCHRESEISIGELKKLLKPALGTSMDGADPETIANIAKELSDILNLDKQQISLHLNPKCSKAVRALCTTIHDYCNSKWEGDALFAESLGNLITFSFCFYFTTDVIQVGSHAHESPAKSGKLNDQKFQNVKVNKSSARDIPIEREKLMSLTIGDFKGFQLPVFTLPTDENTAYVESAWSSRLATTFLIPIFSFYQMNLRQEKMESIEHFNTNALKRPDFSVVRKGGSDIASLSVNTNSLKNVTDDEILLSLEIKLGKTEIKLGKTKIKLGKTKNKLDDTILLQLVANMAVTKTRICLLITPDTTFKVEYEGIKDHNRERKVHLPTAKFLDKSAARCIFQQLREREDYRMIISSSWILL